MITAGASEGGESLTENNYKFIKKFYAAMMIFTALGAAAGALYYIGLGEAKDNINNYVGMFFDTVKNGKDGSDIMLGALKEYLIVGMFFTLLSLIRPGVIMIPLPAVRYGFIYGFTNAALISSMQQKGLYIALIRLPAIFFALLGIYVLGSVSAGLSVSREGRKIKFFIFILIISCTIFCVAAAWDGFLTTTFMKILSKWLT